MARSFNAGATSGNSAMYGNMIGTKKAMAAGKTAAANRRQLLEQTRLSRRPKMPERASGVAARNSAAAICINCLSSLKNESEFARRISVCPACLAIYSKIDDAITRANENRAYSIFER